MQKGQTPVLILVGILIIIVVAGGAYFLGKSANSKPSSTPVVTSQSPQPALIPQSTPDASPAPTGAGETTNWKIYTNSEYGFSFKYPSNWKYEPNPAFPTTIAFFEVGVTPIHHDGDTKSNEVFNFSPGVNDSSLDELKKEYYPDAIDTTVDGKPALKTPAGEIIIKPSSNKPLIDLFIANRDNATLQKVLSTFKFQ